MNDQPLYPLFVRPVDPNAKEPFSDDLFERKKLADQLTGCLSRLPEGCVFGIDAPWGDGKSWFAQNWRGDLEKNGYQVIYLDAFQKDYIEDPFLMISGEILKRIKQDQHDLRRRFLETGKKVGTALLPMATKLAVNATGRWILGTSNLSEGLQRAAKDLQEEGGDTLENLIERRLSGYEADHLSVENFRAALSELGGTPEKPLVFMIDELDRCRPDFAVKTIERIKHFFDVRGVVFVLLLNREQLAASVRGVYGSEIDSEMYLGKFLQFTVSLPKVKSFELRGRDHNVSFAEKTLMRYGFSKTDPVSGFARAMGFFATHMGLSFRDIERAVVLYSFAQPVNDSSVFLAWPIALKLKHPDIFRGVLEGLPESHQQAKELLAAVRKATPDFGHLDLLGVLHNFYRGSSQTLSAEQAYQLPGSFRIRPEMFMPWLCSCIDLTIKD